MQVGNGPGTVKAGLYNVKLKLIRRLQSGEGGYITVGRRREKKCKTIVVYLVSALSLLLVYSHILKQLDAEPKRCSILNTNIIGSVEHFAALYSRS